jgi:ADP-heptose:LPS heptosyltransferase
LLVPAKLKIGFPYHILQARILYDIATQRSDLDFEVTDMLKTLNILGIKTSYPHEFRMPGTPLARIRPYIAYFTGAAVPEKCWPTSNYIELIRILSKQYPTHDHIILEGMKSWESADTILASLADHANVLAHQAETIEETSSFLMGADLLISNDTGIRHLAIVSGTDTVGIFLADPFRYWPRYNNHKVVFGKAAGEHASMEDVLIECRSALDNSYKIHHV